MSKTGEDAEKPKKKSKKNKNVASDLLDGGDLLKEKGHKHREKKRKSESNEDVDDVQDKGNLVNDHVDLQKKRKSESKEDRYEVRHDKGTLVNDRAQSQKKRKRDIKDNERGRNDEPAVERDCDLKLRKKKTTDEKKKMKKNKEKEKEKKKIDGQNSDVEINEVMTEEATLKTRDMEDKKGKKQANYLEKEKVKVKGSKVKNKTKETEKPKAKGKSKKVSFSGDVEVFPVEQTTKGDGLIQGKRFTPEEDAIVKEAVLNYITARGLGDEGLKMVLSCKSHKGMKKCWQEIGTCIPYRPYSAVYYRAHILFERAEARSWTPEEIAFLKESHEKYGNNWKMVAEELGKHRFHVKDTWRRIKLENLKGGKWSQEEYQNLYDLVNMDLLMKVNGQEKKSKHGMLRDNIPWTAISEKLLTRSDATCCTKWYSQLTSSLVAEKKWCDADDYRMIGALYELDAACVEDVDWDNLLEHRPGNICLKRWNQMVKHIGHNGCMPFAEQVDTLAKRYCPDLAETREAWDKKPVVP